MLKTDLRCKLSNILDTDFAHFHKHFRINEYGLVYQFLSEISKEDRTSLEIVNIIASKLHSTSKEVSEVFIRELEEYER